MLLRFSKKENILIINKRNITEFTNADYPEFHCIILFIVYAFHMVNVSFIRCINLNEESLTHRKHKP